MENNRSLPFIGITVTRNNNSFSTGFYHKPTSTDLKTHFTSFNSTVYKLSAIRSLAHRTIHLSSNYESITIENLINYLNYFYAMVILPHWSTQLLRNYLTIGTFEMTVVVLLILIGLLLMLILLFIFINRSIVVMFLFICLNNLKYYVINILKI